MEKQEITAGLKAAVEKGYSLEVAKRSFINAGYNAQDVEDSSKLLMGYTSTLPLMMPTTRNPGPQQSQQQQHQQIPSLLMPTSNTSSQNQGGSGDIKMKIVIITLAVILVLLLGVLVSSIFFKDNLIEILKNIGINLG